MLEIFGASFTNLGSLIYTTNNQFGTQRFGLNELIGVISCECLESVQIILIRLERSPEKMQGCTNLEQI